MKHNRHPRPACGHSYRQSDIAAFDKNHIGLELPDNLAAIAVATRDPWDIGDVLELSLQIRNLMQKSSAIAPIFAAWHDLVINIVCLKQRNLIGLTGTNKEYLAILV